MYVYMYVFLLRHSESHFLQNLAYTYHTLKHPTGINVNTSN
jgi:hypothetical protein